MRALGKRQLGEMELSELITTLLLSEIAAVPMIDFKIPIERAIVPILLIISFEIMIPFFSEKNSIIRNIFEGKPSYIIHKGKLRISELRKNRLTVDELVSELRVQGYFDISDIDCAILENNGKISVLSKGNISSDDSRMVYDVIINGKIRPYNLKLCGLDASWLEKKLRSLGTTVKNVILLSVDDMMNITAIVDRGSKRDLDIQKISCKPGQVSTGSSK
jgi:uncharacterized membrane protein YcaP (DUF421 family)